MIKYLISVIAVIAVAAGIGCASKRWADGDPRDKTPLPTPEVIATVVIGVGVDATSNSGTANGF